MGGVAPGSPVSASNTNQAFIDANADDTGVGIYTFANTDPASGPTVVNNQREQNSTNSYTGRPAASAYNAKPTWTDPNAGLSTDDLTQRSEALTAKMNPSTGHSHDGTVGNGPPISATKLTNVNLVAFVQQGTDLTGVTGGSTDVSTELTGKTPSSAPTNIGVVVNAPYNKVILTQASGANEGDKIVDGSGHVVYGRLTESAGPVWTLTYYVDIAGTETPYSFGSSTDVRWYYQEIFNPLDGVNVPPVYNSLFFTPSDNATADVIDATPSVRGLVNTGTQSFGGNKTFTDDVAIDGNTRLDTSLTGPLRATAGAISTGDTDLTSEVVGELPIANGGTNAATRTDAFDNLAPASPTKGDLLVYNGTHWVKIPVGTNGQTLVADSAQTEGIKWGVGITYRAGNEALSLGASNHTFTFSSAMPNTNYRISVSFVNTVDTYPAFLPYTVIAKTTTTFQISWNSQLDSANYSADYTVTGDN